jgi:hypothetical protein
VQLDRDAAHEELERFADVRRPRSLAPLAGGAAAERVRVRVHFMAGVSMR